MKDYFLFYRQRLADARLEARRVVFLVEEKVGKATLRAATDLKPARSFTVPMPYREYCSYTSGNGECIS